MKVTSPANYRIVLIRARNPLNIGAAARALKNFGFTELALVATHPPVWKEARSAVGARDLLAGARTFGTTAEAVADCTLVAGTTSGHRHPHEPSFITPAELARKVTRLGSGAKVAILFGSEKTGLTREELSHCHAVVRIPTDSRAPSMNLGQAVAVCCYELAQPRRRVSSREDASQPLATAASIEALLHEMTQVLEAARFFHIPASSSRIAKLRRTLLRLELSDREVEFFRGATRHLLRRLKAQGN